MDTDLQLLERWQAKDQEAGKRLVREHHESIAAFFRNAVDDDRREMLVKETFGRFSRAREAFRRDAGVLTHLFQVARRVLLDHLREHAPGSPQQPDPVTLTVAAAPPSQAVARLQLTRPLLDCLRALPIDTKQLLELRYWHGCTFGELGKIFEQPEAVIRQQLPDALIALRQVLAKGREQVGPDAEATDQAIEQELRQLGKLMVSKPSE